MNNNNYLNAAEAHKLTAEHVINMQIKFLDEIMSEIKNAVSKGKFYINYYKLIDDNCIKALEDLGYKVEDLYNQKDGYTYLISW